MTSRFNADGSAVVLRVVGGSGSFLRKVLAAVRRTDFELAAGEPFPATKGGQRKQHRRRMAPAAHHFGLTQRERSADKLLLTGLYLRRCGAAGVHALVRTTDLE
jgi:hypothetical protein